MAASSPQNVSLAGVGTDFSIDVATGGSASATVTAGQTATYNLQVTPVSGFSAAVSLSCTGAPSEATCTPSSVTPNGTFTVTSTTTAPSMVFPVGEPRNWPPFYPLRIGVPLLLALMLLAQSARVRDAMAQRRRGFACASAFGLLLLAGLLINGCSGNGKQHNPGTPAGTYMMTVTGTSNGVSHTRTLTLTVN